MIRAILTGLAVFFAGMLALLGLAIAQSYVASMIGSPVGDVVFFFVCAICVLAVASAWRRFAR